jgi:phosphopantetheinyl transferase
LELANELVPERVPIMVERIRAIRWIEIEPPVDLVLKADFDGVDRVNVSIGEYLTGTVVLAQAYPPALAPIPFHIASGQEPHITAREHYQERWAFHGPAYQGLIEIGPMTDRGIHGVISCLPARGALLDAAGQLAGYWCTAHTEKDRLALPYRIDRIRYFGPHPAPGTHFEANVHVQELTEVWARFDVEIFRENTLWARIEGLEDRRFQSDQNFFRVWQFPGSNSAAILRSHGYCIVNESWSTSASRYFIARLYLNSDELKEYHAKPIRSQRAWLLGRIAIKDIVRNLLWEQGANNIFPKEVRVINNSAGRPIVSGPWREDLRVSVAHKEYIAVAIAAVGANIGIDLETIGVRDRAFEQASFHDAELALFPERDRDEWITRAWVAKEAVAKSLGTGLQGSPRSLILSRIEGERLMIAGVWVITRRDGDQIIGWTDHPQIWQPKVTPKQV